MKKISLMKAGICLGAKYGVNRQLGVVRSNNKYSD